MVGEKVEFYGETLSLLAISKKIGISRETLNKYYISTGNIYEAESLNAIQKSKHHMCSYKNVMPY